MLNACLVAAAVWIVYLGVAIAVLRLFRPVRRIFALRAVFLLCAPLVLALVEPVRRLEVDALVPARLQFALVTAAAFGAIAYVYLQVYSAIDTSITIRILVHFYEAGSRPLSRAEIEALYPFDELLNRKMDYMVRDGLIAGGDCLELTARGRRVGGVLHGVKSLLRLGDGG
jgi:hypothetical protein